MSFLWPDPPLHVVLVEPEIPPNTGNIARTCAATGTCLHLVHPLGFEISDKHLKRAGLDYWPHVRLREHASFETFLADAPRARLWYFSKKAERGLYDADFRPGDRLVFGPETRGLPEPLLEKAGARALRLPMRGTAVRSLNLGTSVGVALYEALRQIDAAH